jgi:hypothetical protein
VDSQGGTHGHGSDERLAWGRHVEAYRPASDDERRHAGYEAGKCRPLTTHGRRQ